MTAAPWCLQGGVALVDTGKTLALYTHARAHTRARARRYQVGFSGDVHELTWSNLAYQPYFSVRVQRQRLLVPAVTL